MLKIVVYDSGFGGELFADRLEEELKVVEVVRVIDWKNAVDIQSNSHFARRAAEVALRPYIGNADLIVLANHLVSLTSLKYFQRKYPTQKFIGFSLKTPDTFVKRDTLILTTSSVAHTIKYRSFVFRLRRKSKTLTLDDWPAKIDDGELSDLEIRTTLKTALLHSNLKPTEVILACSQFKDIEQELRHFFGRNLRIHDSFRDAFHETCKVLKIRGSASYKTKSRR